MWLSNALKVPVSLEKPSRCTVPSVTAGGRWVSTNTKTAVEWKSLFFDTSSQSSSILLGRKFTLPRNNPDGCDLLRHGQTRQPFPIAFWSTAQHWRRTLSLSPEYLIHPWISWLMLEKCPVGLNTQCALTLLLWKKLHRTLKLYETSRHTLTPQQPWATSSWNNSNIIGTARMGGGRAEGTVAHDSEPCLQEL